VNSVTVVGNLGADPELRYTASGKAVCNFNVAVNERWREGNSGEWKERTHWIRVDCWSQLAENVAESAEKGTRVVVIGKLQSREWETDEGEKRSALGINAEDVAIGLRFATVSEIRHQRSGSQDS
jgi:single-strand DNA-binding protein